MAINWSVEQQQVINQRNSNILVSAAAGSGKTAVLVERIITRLTKDKEPINVDELLIVTFTEAAAGEMKERILAAIEKALELDPDNEHLQRQATLIHSASIMTIHGFCLSVIKEHFHTIDLDPVFRVGDEGELKLLRQDVVARLLEQEYKKGSQSFLAFVEAMAPGRSDKNIEELILELFKYSRSYPQPKVWLQSCMEQYDITTVTELEQSDMVQIILEDTHCMLCDILKKIQFAIELTSQEDGHKPYMETFENEKVLFEYAKGCTTFAECYEAIHTIQFAALSRKQDKNADPDKKEFAKKLRDSYKKEIEDLKSNYYAFSPEEQVELIGNCKPIAEEIVRLINLFTVSYQGEKRKRNLLDFNDMEHYALQILTREANGELVPSEVAKGYQDKFQEVMIDEYQDSNFLQESLLTSVSKVPQGSYNMFMVGDVKQSIYKFRLSRPELFMGKFREYAKDGVDKVRIDLGKNFRSRAEVLDSTNFVFEKIMKISLGGVAYDEKARLNLGASYEEVAEVDNTAELLLLEDTVEEEAIDKYGDDVDYNAIVVANQIKEIVGHHLVLDKKTGTYRPAQYRDIVILTRTMKDWGDRYAKHLLDEGVPASVESSEGYFNTWEVAVLLDYLSVLDNFKQDIPLAAVLRSPFGNLSDNEMAIIRNRYPAYAFCDAVLSYGRTEESDGIDRVVQKKLLQCIGKIEVYRKKAAHMAIHDLLIEILEETGYKQYVAALPGGQQRSANIEMLLEKSASYESTSYKGLFNFIRYIELLKKYEVDFGEASLIDEQDDVVRIMSIHKSKGLEFPIVFVIGMHKSFNMMDAKKSVVVHPDLGLGLDCIDTKKRLQVPSLMKNVIKKQIKLDALGEELRVLYVAMTRAKEKLYLTGRVEKFEDKKSEYQGFGFEKDGTISYSKLIKASGYMDWVLPCVYGDSDQQVMRPHMVTLEELEMQKAEEVVLDLWKQEWLTHVAENGVIDEAFHERIEEQFGYQYPYESEQDFNLKITVTELKKRAQLAEEGGATWEEEEAKKEWKPATIPEFMQGTKEAKTGAFRGTAYHRLMEILDFTKAYTIESLERDLGYFVERKLLTSEMAECIDEGKVLEFLESSLGKRMQNAAKDGKLFKEQPFVIGLPTSQVYQQESDEIVLVQGIIDVYFEEDGELVVLDYKTDRVKSVTVLKDMYHTQLEYYGKSLSQLTGKEVKEKVIYSFQLHDYCSW